MEWYQWLIVAILVLLVLYYLYMSYYKQGVISGEPHKIIEVSASTIKGLKLPEGFRWAVSGPKFYTYDQVTKMYYAQAISYD